MNKHQKRLRLTPLAFMTSVLWLSACNIEVGENANVEANLDLTPPTNTGQTLIANDVEPEGEHCPTGGIKVSSGVDTNHDGVLQEAEISLIDYRCHVADNVLDEAPDSIDGEAVQCFVEALRNEPPQKNAFLALIESVVEEQSFGELSSEILNTTVSFAHFSYDLSDALKYSNLNITVNETLLDEDNYLFPLTVGNNIFQLGIEMPECPSLSLPYNVIRESSETIAHQEEIRGAHVELSEDGNTLAMVFMGDFGDPVVEILNRNNNQWEQEKLLFNESGYFINSLSLSKDGNTLAVNVMFSSNPAEVGTYIYTKDLSGEWTEPFFISIENHLVSRRQVERVFVTNQTLIIGTEKTIHLYQEDNDSWIYKDSYRNEDMVGNIFQGIEDVNFLSATDKDVVVTVESGIQLLKIEDGSFIPVSDEVSNQINSLVNYTNVNLNVALNEDWLAVASFNSSMIRGNEGVVHLFFSSDDVAWNYHRTIKEKVGFGSALSLKDHGLMVGNNVDREISFYQFESDHWQFQNLIQVPNKMTGYLFIDLATEGTFVTGSFGGGDVYQ